MKASRDNVLFIGDNSFWSDRAYEFLDCIFERVTAVFWDYGNPNIDVHRVVDEWSGDWIISFKSDLLLDQEVIEHAKNGAINFHPAPVNYRGIGGYHYAIDNHDAQYGVTCHHMDNEVNHGRIIKSVEFPLLEGETVEELRQRAANYCLTLLYDICSLVANKHVLPVSEMTWGSKLYTRAALQRYLESKNQDLPVCLK